jgi:hypothetical protein
MALKATRTTGPLAPPSMNYRVAATRLQLSCGFNLGAGPLIVRRQFRGGLEANFFRAKSSSLASVQTS